MIIRVFLALLLTAGLGALGVIGWLATHAHPPAQQAAAAPVQVTANVLVSTRVLHAGGLVQPQDLATRAFPQDAMAAGAMLDTPATRARVIGALLRVSVPSGGLLLATDMVLPGDHGYLAAVLTPGTRAVSVGVDATTGNAGLIWPGDHVDLILTQSLEDTTTPASHRMVAETVLSDIRVIATDQDLVRGELPASNGRETRTITLETTPAQAARISIASRMGHLSLSLCAVDSGRGTQMASAPVMVWSGDVSPALSVGMPHKASADDAVHLFDGTTDQKEYHF